MTTRYPGEFIYGGGGGGGSGSSGTPSIGGVPQTQQIHNQGMNMNLEDQIGQRKVDLLMGKRCFGDFQNSQQQQQQNQYLHQQYQQQQQQQQQMSYLQNLRHQRQQQQQPMVSQNQLMMRSIKQRTNNHNNGMSSLSSPIDLCSPTNNNINNINNMLMNNSTTRFGVPVYHQPQPQQQINLPNTYQLNYPTQFNSSNFNNNINNNINYNNNNNPFLSSNINNNNNQLMNPRQGAGLGYSNPGPIPVVPKVEPEDQKILNTLQELEKHLLDDDDFDVANDKEGDAVSGVTNNEWSETIQNLISPNPSPSPGPITNPSPSPSPITVQNSASTICSNTSTPNNNNNNNNSNNVISPSPTSSASSCCSASASAAGSPPPTVTTTTTVSVPAVVSAKQLIVDTATAISEGRNDVVAELLSKLGQIVDCKGNSEQRLAYHMHNALKSRALPSENPPPVMELYSKDQISAVYNLYDISPCFKFGLLAANLVMLEAITSAMQEGLKVHVIDFDVGQGAQYVNLLRALADRKCHAPPSFGMKITVVETELGDHGGVPASVKEGLVGLAERVGINLSYSSVTRKITELTRESLGCEEGEAIVVNFAFKLYRVPDESVSMENLRDELLRRVKDLSPRAVTLVEQDMNGNTAPFMTRVNEACGYYGALFDSLEATLPRENPDRCRVEDGLGRKIVNLIACEGRERVERAEVFGKWRARMGMAGFKLKAISSSVAESMRAKLNSARGGNPGFTVKEENGGVGFGWMGRSLTAASAWR